ncbi:ABC transporter B family member 15 [Linum perenne]
MAVERENQSKKKKKSSLGSLRSIFMHADGLDWLLILLGVLGSIGDGFSVPLTLFITSRLMNTIGDSAHVSSQLLVNSLNKNALDLCYLAVGELFVCFLEGYCWTRTAGRQAARLRTRYLKAVLRQDVGYFDVHSRRTSDVITIISNDTLLIQDVLSEKLPNFIMNVATFLGYYLIAFVMLWRLAIVSSPFIVLLLVPGLIYGRTLMALATKMREDYSKADAIAQQAISSIRTVYAFAGETSTMTAYCAALHSTLRLGLRQGLAKGLAIGSNGIVYALWGFMAYYGSRLVMYHGAKGGTVFVVGSNIALGGLALGACLANVKYLSEAAAAGEGVMEVIQRVPKIDVENMEGDILENMRGEVEFRNVEFAYPSRAGNIILKNFSVTVPSGTSIALVGESGSGKSTVISLLQRFYDPVCGEILLDGVSIDKLQLKWVRSQMGVVSQEPSLFATSIKENILFGKEDATIEEIEEAARAANAHGFISKLPQGYDTQVGERGVQMSGGQKQRIDIARAIIKAPRILLLDEATSALDAKSERLVQQALDKAAIGRTTITIAHRLSTIQYADSIATVQNGSIVESGSHEELIRNEHGLYTSMLKLQETQSVVHQDMNKVRSGRRLGRSSSSSAKEEEEEEEEAMTLTVEKKQIQQTNGGWSVKRMLGLSLPEWKQAAVGCSGAIVFGGIQPAFALVLGSMLSVLFWTDHGEIKANMRLYAMAFLGLALLNLVVNVIQHYCFGYMGEHLSMRIREMMLSNILTLELGWFDQEDNSSAAVCSRIAKDANQVRALLGDRTALLLQTISAVTISCTMGLLIAWRIAIVMIAVMPILIACFYSRRVLLQRSSSKAIIAQKECSKIASEAVSNFRTITAFSSQDRIISMLDKAQDGPRRESIRQSWHTGIGLGITNFLIILLTNTLDFWYGGKLLSQDLISVKALFQTFLILVSTGRVIADTGATTSDLTKGSDAIIGVFAVLDRSTKIEPVQPQGYKPLKIEGHIELCDVDFSYPARPAAMIFKGFSIKIEAGKSTALVGPSGSGKSTIIALIERFYDPINGSVKIDGRDIRSYHLRSLRKHIALVNQEPTLFAGTIRENITYGTAAEEGVDESAVIDAAKAANAHEFIAGLEEGYDTECGDRGVQLSGGQKQRIAIARAIMRNPTILLLDEATSALDTQSEKLVQEAAERVMVGRTSLIVAHRLSTIQNSDLIVVLDGGKVNAVALCYVACGQGFFCFLEGYFWTRTSARQAARIRASYLRAVLRQEVSYFDLHVTSPTEIITTVSNDCLVIQDALSEKFPFFLMNLAMFLGCYVVGFILQWRLTIVGLPFVILLVVPGILYGRTLMVLARQIGEEYNKAGNIAEQAISSIRTVYAFVGETKTYAAYSATLDLSVILGLKQGLAKGLAIGSNGIVFAIWSFMSYYGSRMVMYHGSKGGTVFSVSTLVAVGGLAFGSCLSNLKYFSEALSAGERMTEMIVRVPEIDIEKMEGVTLEDVKGEVEFRHVKFAYPARPEKIVIKDLCLHVPSGKTVALVGSSGSGKSTVVALLQRFYDPLGGEILVDNVSIDKLQLKWLRAQMGLVSQEPILFATSIKENIRFGKEDATNEEITKASKASNAHNFICQLPQGYDTQVGERGVQMSGGQKQRIAIARAIIRAPKILLLDEATSALDSESEKVVQEALNKASLGRTTIIIAHRMSTIRNVDTIAVVQNGQVMETGSHDELIHHDDGLYLSLVRAFEKEGSDNDENNEAVPPHSSSLVLNSEINSVSSRRLSIASSSSSVNSIQLIPSSVKGEQQENTLQSDLGTRKKVPAPSFWRLLALNSREWKQVSFGCVGAVLFGGVQPTYSFAMGSMVSVYFFKDHDQIKEQTRIYSLSFLGLALICLIVNIVQHYNFGYMGEQLTKRIREKMLSKILTFEIGWFDQDQNSSGAVCSRLDKDANVVRSVVGDRMSLLVQTISSVVVAWTMGLVIAPKLAIIMITVQPIFIVCFYVRHVLIKSMSQKAVQAQNKTGKLASEAVSNLRTITSFSSQDRILEMLNEAQEGSQREFVRQSWYAGLGLSTSQCLMLLTTALDLWYGGKLISQREISVRAVFETFLILINTGPVIANAGAITTDLAKGSDTVRSLFDILDRETGIKSDDPQGYKLEKMRGQVEFQDVDFAYPARPSVMVFEGFSLNIEAGKSTALVGQSGSGKSTVISLIERFYDPLRGTVRIDSQDIRTYNLRSLRRHIALVSQEPTLFAATIKENITYGSLEMDETEIIEVAKAANAHEFISGLKDGYNTWCGDKGVQLSGGQKQRIAIARAILRNPRVLLLDEATSALDGKSEKAVQDAVERVMVGRTSVVVAHRLSTIRNCDAIVVLDKGKVAESGTHSSLLARGPNGAYYSLVNLQRMSPHS